MPFFQPGKASVVVGGQFGSEAKGLVAASLAMEYMAQVEPHLRINKILCTTNAGAQAGHTTVLEDGRRFVCYHLPTIGVLVPEATIYLNAGSIIDPDLLLQEVGDVASALGVDPLSIKKRVVIHPSAAVISDHHKSQEKGGLTTHLASTMKGVGAAQADKIVRKPEAVAAFNTTLTKNFHVYPLSPMSWMDDRVVVTVEIPQGTGLSINAAPFYPKCTSRDCWLGQGLTDAGIHPSYLGKVALVVRTFPIRVGNVYDDGGNLIGNSGPFYPDSHELSWGADFPRVTPEITTVTKRVRRIAGWSNFQYLDALQLNRPDRVYLTFINYMRGLAAFNQRVDNMRLAHKTIGKYPQIYASWGPRVDQVAKVPEDQDRSMMEFVFSGAFQ